MFQLIYLFRYVNDNGLNLQSTFIWNVFCLFSQFLYGGEKGKRFICFLSLYTIWVYIMIAKIFNKNVKKLLMKKLSFIVSCWMLKFRIISDFFTFLYIERKVFNEIIFTEWYLGNSLSFLTVFNNLNISTILTVFKNSKISKILTVFENSKISMILTDFKYSQKL